MYAVTSELRTPVLIHVEASWEDTDRTPQTARALIEDKSLGGACIRLKNPIVVGSKVGIQWRFEQFSGTVRYCRLEGAEYRVGIQRDRGVSPMPNRPRPSVVAAQKSPRSSGSPDFKSQNSEPKRQPSEAREAPTVAQKVVTAPTVRIASSIPTPSRAVDIEIAKKDSARPEAKDLGAIREAGETKQLPEQAKRERKHMESKWLKSLWSDKEEKDLSRRSPGNDEAIGEGNSKKGKEHSMPHSTQPTDKPLARFAREVPNFEVELVSMEEIYRAAGIMEPRGGYNINKVIEMLQSEHIRDLSKEMKRAAILMALDMAGVPFDQVQKDAKARQNALDSHESQQKKLVDAEWSRKADEIVQIQAELESIKAHYTARISRNMVGIEVEKATFNNWVTLKQQESQSITDAVALCLKSPVSEPAKAVIPAVSVEKAIAKTV